MTAHIVFDFVRSIETLTKAVRLFVASLHSQPMCSQHDIFVGILPVGSKSHKLVDLGRVWVAVS